MPQLIKKHYSKIILLIKLLALVATMAEFLTYPGLFLSRLGISLNTILFFCFGSEWWLLHQVAKKQTLAIIKKSYIQMTTWMLLFVAGGSLVFFVVDGLNYTNFVFSQWHLNPLAINSLLIFTIANLLLMLAFRYRRQIINFYQ